VENPLSFGDKLALSFPDRFAPAFAEEARLFGAVVSFACHISPGRCIHDWYFETFSTKVRGERRPPVVEADAVAATIIAKAARESASRGGSAVDLLSNFYPEMETIAEKKRLNPGLRRDLALGAAALYQL
jgi:hypothetical protein